MFDYYISDTAMQIMSFIPTVTVYLFILYYSIVDKKRMYMISGILFFILSLIYIYDVLETFVIIFLFCICILIINKRENCIEIIAVTIGYTLVTNSSLLIHSNQETLFYMMVKLVALQCATFLYQLFSLWKARKDNIKYVLIFQSVFFLFCFITSVLIILFNREMKKGMREVLYFPVLVITVLYLVVTLLFNLFIKNQRVQEHFMLQKMKNEMVNEQYHVLKQKYEDISLLKHDTKHHLQTLSILLYQNDIDKAKEYIQNFSDYMNEHTFVFRSSNQILEIVMNEKYMEAKSMGIDIKMNCEDVIMDWIEDIDIITIFANILDNAIEAATLSKNKKRIEITLVEKGHYIVFEVVNTFSGNLKKINHRFHTTKSGHDGLGLLSVKKAAEKYNGIVQTDNYEDIFITTIFLPVKIEF